MVTDQLSLLDLGMATNPEAPRCRLCPRPAHWLRNKAQWGMYCNGYNCNNRERTCQSCGQAFMMNADGAGTKYCSAGCKADGYRPHRVGPKLTMCAWCETEVETTRRPILKDWPFVCNACITPIRHVLQRLRGHHVPHLMARRLLDDPSCEVCGRDIVTPVPDARNAALRALLVVDHDHRCCPTGQYSCGQCVRGLICAHCNTAAGMLRDDPAFARSLTEYLSRTRT